VLRAVARETEKVLRHKDQCLGHAGESVSCMRQMKEGNENVCIGEELFAANALHTTPIFSLEDDTACQ
jgi:hypothetical protein